MREPIAIERLTGLIAFARAGSLGSFTAAARALSISPSAVSKSVQRLEQRLGLSLFTRTTRALTLTPEGRDLHDRVLNLLRDADTIEQVAMSARSEPRGALRIATPVMLGAHVIAPTLPAFRERFPEVTVELRIGNEIDDIVGQGIDVAIRIGDVADTQLLSRKLARCRICAFASPAYLASRGIPAHPHDLHRHDTVNLRYKSSGQPFRWPFQVGGRLVEITPTATIVVDASDAVLAALAAGGGIGVTDTFLAAPYLARGELVPILAEFAVEKHDVTALWPVNRGANPAVRAFLNWLQLVFERRSLEPVWAHQARSETEFSGNLPEQGREPT